MVFFNRGHCYLLVMWDISQCTSVACCGEMKRFLKLFNFVEPRSCSGCFREEENLLSRWKLNHNFLDVWPVSCVVFIGMFQVPAGQKETDLVGRSIVHKSAYKQATGNFQMCHKIIKSFCTLFLSVVHVVLFFVLINFWKCFYGIWCSCYVQLWNIILVLLWQHKKKYIYIFSVLHNLKFHAYL